MKQLWIERAFPGGFRNICATEQDKLAALTQLETTATVRFKRKGGGYFYTNLIADRNILRMIGCEFRPTKDWDNVLEQLSGHPVWAECDENDLV